MVLNHIFPVGSTWCEAEQRIQTSDLVLLVENNQSLSLSLLFQVAVSFASKESGVTFICQKPLTSIPTCVHGMPQPDAKTLTTLKFLYLSTTGELTEYCSSIHLKTVLPDILIVSDFHLYIGQDQSAVGEHTAARLLALLLDTVTFIKRKSQSGDCKLLISCSNQIKWISTVASKFGYQIFKLTETESERHKLEWETSNTHYIISFTKRGPQLFMDKLTVKNNEETE